MGDEKLLQFLNVRFSGPCRNLRWVRRGRPQRTAAWSSFFTIRDG